MSENIEKRYLNLVEQVRKNQLDIQGLSAGLKIVGYGPSVPADLQDGESFLKEEGDGYKLYIKVNGNALDMGEFPPKGPQGIPGPQGDAATIESCTEEVETVEPINAADVHVTYNPISGNLNFRFYIPRGADGLRGPMGPAGPRGRTGPTGAEGPQGEPAYAVKIIGTVSNYTSLPTPSSVSRNAAYLVGASAPYHLYVIIGTDALSWMDAGGFEQTVIVTDNALNASSTNPIQNKPVAEQFNKLAAYLNISNYATPGNTLSADILSEMEESGVFFKGDFDAGSGVGYADEAAWLTDKTGETLESGVDDEPFGFRPTAYPFNHATITVSNRATVKKIWAYAFVKNQKITDPTFTSSSNFGAYNSTISASSNELTVTCTGSYGQAFQNVTGGYTSGHKYLVILSAKCESSINVRINCFGVGSSDIALSSSYSKHFFLASGAFDRNSVSVYNNSDSSSVFKLNDFRVIDITQWFNNDSTILGATSESWFIAWFLNNFGKFIPNSLNSGEIENQWATKIKTDGVNLWDEEWEVGSINDYTGIPESNSNTIRSKNFCRCNPDMTFYGYNGKAGSTIVIYFYDEDYNFVSAYDINNKTRQSPINAIWFKIRTNVAYGNVYNHDIQICNHWTETAVEQTYHAHESWVFYLDWSFVGEGNTPHGLTTSLGDCKDYENGVNEVVAGSVDLGSLTWNYDSDNAYFYASLNVAKNSSSIINGICSKYRFVVGNDVASNITGSYPFISVSSYRSNTNNLIVKDTSYTDAATFKTAMSGVILQYELAAKVTTAMSEAEQLNSAYDCNDYGNEQFFNGDDESVACLDVLYQKNLARQIVNNQYAIAAIMVYAKPLPADSADGTYIYKAVKSGYTITYGWVKEE